MTTPRTVAGQAALSGMRPHVKRALAHTILAIEAEAIAPYVEALREADRVLEIPCRQRRNLNVGQSLEGRLRQAGRGRTSTGEAPSRAARPGGAGMTASGVVLRQREKHWPPIARIAFGGRT